MSGTALPTDALKTHSGTFGRQRLARMAGRYSLSAIGPVAVSGAHFLASLIILHHMTRAEFGQFSFLLVIVPFGISLSSGLLGAPLVIAWGLMRGAPLGDSTRTVRGAAELEIAVQRSDRTKAMAGCKGVSMVGSASFPDPAPMIRIL